MTPINIDPEKPALPVSSPVIYSAGLAKLYGDYATLGLAEDTWALNAGVIDEKEFLQQAYDIFKERKTHLFDALKRNKDGLIVFCFRHNGSNPAHVFPLPRSRSPGQYWKRR